MNIKTNLLKCWSKIKKIDLTWNRKNKIISCVALIIIGYISSYYFGNSIFFTWSILIVIGIIFIPMFIKKIKQGSNKKENSFVLNSPDQSQNKMLVCPKCGSNNIFISKRGFNASDACCGAILLGPLGLLCGQDGANKIEKNCLNCGKKF